MQNVITTFFNFPFAFIFSSILLEKIATIIAAIMNKKYIGIRCISFLIQISRKYSHSLYFQMALPP